MKRSSLKVTRQDYIPNDYSVKLRDEKAGALILTGEGGLTVMAFKGRSQKPAFHTRFRAVERAEQYTADWLASVRRNAAYKAEQREIRNRPHTLKAGDVLSSSWGYEQTNVCFYQVIEAKPKMVIIRAIASAVEEVTGAMEGTCVPMVGQFTGEAKSYRSGPDNRVRIASFETASPLEYEEMAGVRIYKPQRYSTYA